MWPVRETFGSKLQYWYFKRPIYMSCHSIMILWLAWCRRRAGNWGNHQEAADKQSDTFLSLGCARWVSDKLYGVTWSAALHSPPVKYSLLFFSVTVCPRLWNGFRALFPFRHGAWLSPKLLKTSASRFTASRSVPSLMSEASLCFLPALFLAKTVGGGN